LQNFGTFVLLMSVRYRSCCNEPRCGWFFEHDEPEVVQAESRFHSMKFAFAHREYDINDRMRNVYETFDVLAVSGIDEEFAYVQCYGCEPLWNVILPYDNTFKTLMSTVHLCKMLKDKPCIGAQIFQKVKNDQHEWNVVGFHPITYERKNLLEDSK
jgi:hypothetical protein